MTTSKEKILFLSATSEIGGAEKVLLSLAASLNSRKYDVLLLTQSVGPLTEEFRKLGKEVLLLQLPAWRKTKNIFRRYFALIKFARLVRIHQVTLIHCNTYRLAPYMVDVIRLLKIPGIVHLHDRLSSKHIQGFCLDKVSAVLAVSEYVKEPFSRYRVPVHVVHNGIETGIFSGDKSFLRNEFSLPPDAKILGMIANFNERKRPGLFIRIAGEVKRIVPNFRFVLVGHNVWDSPVTEDVLRAETVRLGVQGDFIFAGWRNDVPRLLQGFDALALPSESDPFPLVVLEAMAAGVVVFAHSRAGGPSEQLNDGMDGFLVDCEKEEETARRIVDVLADPSLCQQIRQRAADRVKTKFNRETFIHRVEDFYSSLLFSRREMS